jgi:CheY-like chemotaxis protein
MGTEKTRVLVVDDEAGLTRMVRLNLEKTGRFEVREENLATRACATASEFKPHIVILDVVMPEMDGGEVLDAFRADGELKNVPVIFLTATLTKESANLRKGYIQGYPVIAKPVDSKDLIRAIEQNIA